MPTTPTLYAVYRDFRFNSIPSAAIFFGDGPLGSKVQIWDGNTLLGTATVAGNGQWAISTIHLAEGSYHITAIAIDAAGNKSGPTAVLNVLVDETPPAAPTVVLESPGTAGGVPTMFSGTAEPYASVRVYYGSGVFDFTDGIADESGHWRAGVYLNDGNYSVKAVAIDRAGNASPAVTLSFDRGVSDDVGNDAAHATVLPVDSKVSAKIDYFGDVDWFKVSLQELTTYTISLLGAKTGGGTLPIYPYDARNLSLWDPQANGGAGEFIQLSGFITDKADFATLLPVMHSGDYYLSVHAEGQTGSYTLGIATSAHDDFFGDQAHAVAVSVNGTISARFDYKGDLDMFKVRLEAGKTYTFELAPGAGVDKPWADLTVADASGAIVSRGWSNSAGNEAAVLVAPAAGDYYISASYSGSSPGGYQLVMREPADDYVAGVQTNGKLAVGGSVAGAIEVGDDHDWFAVNLQAGTAYAFRLDMGASSSYGNMSLHNAAGGPVSLSNVSYNDGRFLAVTPATSGTYFVDVTNLHGNVQYILRADQATQDDYGASAAGAGLLIIGGSTPGRLETPTDTDWFKIPAQPNGYYTFQVQPLNDDGSPRAETGVVAVIDGAGHVLARGSNTDGRTTLNWQAGAEGDYYLSVSSVDGAYSYVISSTINGQDIYPNNPTTAGTLSPGGVVRSSLDFFGDADWFKVDLQAGHQYTFTLAGLNGDGGTLVAPGLAMYDSSKALVWRANNGLYDPVQTFTATATGTFYVEVAVDPAKGIIGTGTGTYTLKEASADVPLTDTTPPKVTGVNAPNFPGNDPRTQNLAIVFSEPVDLITGTVTLRLAATGEVVEKYDLATSPRLSLQNGLLTIDPTLPLAWGTTYRVELDGVVKDKAGLLLAVPVSLDFVTIEQALNVVGGAGDEVYANSSNSDKIDGGAGLDTVVYKAKAATYNVFKDGANISVWGRDHDMLLNIERIVFNDIALAFDLDGTAGQAYRLYQASFNRTPDTAGLGFWIAQMDKGMTLHEAAQNFIGSGEFQKLFGAAPSDADFVKALYGNVLHRAPDQAGLDYWSGALQHGTARADVLVEFSSSAENQAAVIGQISHGISYIAYH
jgi:hypothetical protein